MLWIDSLSVSVLTAFEANTAHQLIRKKETRKDQNTKKENDANHSDQSAPVK